MYKLGTRISWLEGRQLQAAMAAEAAASATASVFAGTSQGSEVIKAVRAARAGVETKAAAPSRPFDMRRLHVNFADEAGAKESKDKPTPQELD